MYYPVVAPNMKIVLVVYGSDGTTNCSYVCMANFTQLKNTFISLLPRASDGEASAPFDPALRRNIHVNPDVDDITGLLTKRAGIISLAFRTKLIFIRSTLHQHRDLYPC